MITHKIYLYASIEFKNKELNPKFIYMYMHVISIKKWRIEREVLLKNMKSEYLCIVII